MNPEDSVNNGEPSAWGKLVSINPNLQNQDLIKPVYKIGRLDTNDIFIDDIRISGVHCILKLVDGEIILEDTSSNGTYIDKQKIGKGKSMPIMPGRKFYVLHDSKVANKEETLGFILTLNQAQLNSLKRQRMETKKEEEDLIAATTKKMKPADHDLGGFNEGVKCFLCKDCIYKCVTTVPCLHNFCAPCYSEWMERSPNCPECHKEVQEIKKNAFWDNIVKSFLEKNPQYKKTRRECEEMDRKNKIHYNKLVLEKETRKHKEPAESQQEPVVAAQAVTEVEKDSEQAMKRKWVKYYELFHRFTAE